MAKVKAAVQNVDDKYYLELRLPSDVVLIPMSDENPNHVKKAFNKLIAYARAQDFSIEFESDGEDLFSQVAGEYVRQLNREIRGVRAEMKQYGLIQ